MNALVGAICALALQCAFVVGVAGTAVRCRRWWRTPLVHPVPLAPAPRSRLGAIWRVASEVVAFRSLWRATALGWALGWAFHVALLLVLVDHLWLVLDPVPAALWRLHGVSIAIGWVLVAALFGLFVRRLVVARMRLISTPSDHLHLALLGAIALTGLAMRTAVPVDIGAVQAFVRATARLGWPPLAPDAALLAHLAGASLVALVFPFSKLLHAPAVLFSPSLAAVDRPAGRRPGG